MVPDTVLDTADVDVLIVGAGPVGMTLALALAQTPLSVCLVDARKAPERGNDPRALALTHGTRQLLEALNAWNAAAAAPIHDIHVSQRGGFGRCVIDRADYRLPALGYVMRYRDLVAALDAALSAVLNARQSAASPPSFPGRGALESFESLDGVSVRALRERDGRMEAELAASGRPDAVSGMRRARLVVHAEGTPKDDPGVWVADYRQRAVIAEVTLKTASAGTLPIVPIGRAWERFTPDGPLALLPLLSPLPLPAKNEGNEGRAKAKVATFALVWTVPPHRAEELLALGDDAFVTALQRAFGSRLEFAAAGPRASFPLALRARKTLVRPHEVWIGNAAQTLHPVSGQGFNLGIRDAWELAQALRRSVRAAPEGVSSAAPSATAFSVDIPAALAVYARGRRLDRGGGMAFTDAIVRVFSNSIPPLNLARGLGLCALDLVPPARHFVARRMIWGARG